MIFNPHNARQSKNTSQILILHAMKRCPLQKTLALELVIPESRVSEWKTGKGNMPTDIALNLIEKFGSPSQAKGVYKGNCKLLPQEQSLDVFFDGLVCNQISRLIAGYLMHIRCIVIPDRNINLGASVEDHFISQMLEDEQFIFISNKFVQLHYRKERHWTDSDDFLLNSSDIELSHTFKGEQSSLLSLLNKHNLGYLLENKEYKYLCNKKRPSSNELLSFLTYTSVVISDLRSMPNTILSTWLSSTSEKSPIETYRGEVSLTGELVHEWYSQDICGTPVFSSYDDTPCGHSQFLLNHMLQLKEWVSEYEGSMEHSLFKLMKEQTPLYNFNEKNKKSLMLVNEILVFHKEESSYLNMAITVSPHQRINKVFKDEEFTLIIEEINTTRLLDELIPLLNAIGLANTMTEVNTKYTLAKLGLIMPGVVSI
jgi:hypothetical protein